MKTSETQIALVGALFAAKGKFPRISKNKEGQAGNRKFKYAPLDEINDHIDPVLREHGLMITQGTEGHELITRLEHISGEWREIRMPINAEHANMQSYGIEVTYRRRYSVQLIVGIVTEEDTDIREKNRRSGIDHTDEKNANGTRKVGYTDNPKRDAFEALPPEIQDSLRMAAPQVDAAIPDVTKAIEIASMAVESWTDADSAEVKKGLWYLLDSKTRSAIDAVQKAGRSRRAQQESAAS
jgi:ERF superfamily